MIRPNSQEWVNIRLESGTARGSVTSVQCLWITSESESEPILDQFGGNEAFLWQWTDCVQCLLLLETGLALRLNQKFEVASLNAKTMNWKKLQKRFKVVRNDGNKNSCLTHKIHYLHLKKKKNKLVQLYKILGFYSLCESTYPLQFT